MFTAFTAGAFLVVTGSIGLNVSYMHGFFDGIRWVDGPVWWQIGLGSGLLLLGVFWSRRLGEPRWTSTRATGRIVKDAGAGKAPGAGQREDQRSLARGQPKP